MISGFRTSARFSLMRLNLSSADWAMTEMFFFFVVGKGSNSGGRKIQINEDTVHQ
jgi:hypothetical protein